MLASASLATAPGAAAAEWSRASSVPGSTAAGFPFDVAVGPGGLTAVAFIRGGLRVAVRDARGRWRPVQRVSRGATAIAAPDVEVSGNGEVIVAWTQSSRRSAPLRGPNDIEVAVRSRRGRWSAPRAVGASQHFIAADPRLAVNSRGDAALMWRGQSGRGSRALDALRAALRPAGGSFGRDVSLGEAGIDQRVLVDPRGHVHAVWTRTLPPEHLRSEIRYAGADAGRGFTPARTIHRDGDGGPALARLPDGSLVVAWRSGEQGIGATRAGPVMVAVGSSGGAFGPSRVLSDVPTEQVQLGVSAGGETLIAWSPALDDQEAAPERTLYWATRPPGGDFSAINVTPGIRAGPVGVLADGTAVTVGDGPGVEAAFRPAAGAFGPPRQISAPGDFPSLATAGRRAVTVWLSRGRLRVSTLAGA
jgi:hypothetical protein